MSGQVGQLARGGIIELANATQIGADAIAQGNVSDAEWKRLLAAAV